LARGRIELSRKNFDLAEKVLEECLEKARGIKNMYICAQALFYLGMLNKEKGDKAKMKELFSEAYEKFNRMEIASFLKKINELVPEIK